MHGVLPLRARPRSHGAASYYNNIMFVPYGFTGRDRYGSRASTVVFGIQIDRQHRRDSEDARGCLAPPKFHISTPKFLTALPIENSNVYWL